jgi:hypothetical protein
MATFQYPLSNPLHSATDSKPTYRSSEAVARFFQCFEQGAIPFAGGIGFDYKGNPLRCPLLQLLPHRGLYFNHSQALLI